MHHADERGDVFDFVRLEVPDEMPFDILRQLGLFFEERLCAVLPEYLVAGMVDFPDGIHANRLCHGDQFHMVGDFLPDLLKMHG
jgi:hypothetical protein